MGKFGLGWKLFLMGEGEVPGGVEGLGAVGRRVGVPGGHGGLSQSVVSVMKTNQANLFL